MFQNVEMKDLDFAIQILYYQVKDPAGKILYIVKWK